MKYVGITALIGSVVFKGIGDIKHFIAKVENDGDMVENNTEQIDELADKVHHLEEKIIQSNTVPSSSACLIVEQEKTN